MAVPLLVSEAASPRLVSVIRTNSWSPLTSVSPAEQAHLSPEAAAALGMSPDLALPVQLQADRPKDQASFSVPGPVTSSLQEQASPDLQQAASDLAAALGPQAVLKVISRAKSSPPGDSCRHQYTLCQYIKTPLHGILPAAVTCLQNCSNAGMQPAAHSMCVLNALQSTYS